MLLYQKKTEEICLFMTKPIVYNPVLIFYIEKIN